MKRGSIEKLNPGEEVGIGAKVEGQCPVCGCPLSTARDSFTPRGSSNVVTTFWPQCVASQEPDHGWGPKSRFRAKSPGNPNFWKAKTGEPTTSQPNETQPDEPEETPEPMETPKANDAAQSLASAIAGIMAQVGASGPEIEALKSRVEAIERKEGRIEAIKIGDLPPV